MLLLESCSENQPRRNEEHEDFLLFLLRFLRFLYVDSLTNIKLFSPALGEYKQAPQTDCFLVRKARHEAWIAAPVKD
jgi:hypothetical protein